MTSTSPGKPSAMLPLWGSKSSRWYPHEALATIAGSSDVASHDDGFPWDLLTPEDAAEHLPALRDNLRNLTRFVAMIEAIAEGRQPTTCPGCETRFYPSRSDAVYCSGRCRTRAHRGRGES